MVAALSGSSFFEGTGAAVVVAQVAVPPLPPECVTAVGEPRGVSVTLHAHDAAARALGADYALASPFGAVEGKGAALGPEGLAAMVDRARPSAVIALGGIRGPAEVAACLDAGAVGVAVRGVWLDTAEVASVLGPLHAALARRG